MRTVDRYFLREILVPFTVGMGLFFVVVAFAQVLKISDAVTGLGITAAEVIIALLYSFPPLMGLLIPVSMLFATLLAVGRLASDREFVALSAAGVSGYRHLVVPAGLGTLLGVLCAMALIFGEPWGIRGLRRVISTSAQRALASGVRIGEFNQWVPGVTFMAQGEKDGELLNVVFADRRDKERPVVISARRGRVLPGERSRDILFVLRDGAIVLHGNDSEVVRVLHFEKSHYLLDVWKSVRPPTMPKDQGLTLKQLIKAINNPKKSRRRRAALTVILHRKFALPVATLIFGLLALPLAMRATSGARARGFLYSAAIVGAYYYIGRAVELVARGGSFPPSLAAWVPNMLGLVALAYLLWRMRRGVVA